MIEFDSMSPAIVSNRGASFTLAAWSGVILIFFFNGRIDNLLAPSFRIYALFAGVVLGFMAIVLWWVPGDLHPCRGEVCMQPGSSPLSRRVKTLLLWAPLLLAMLAGDGDFSFMTVANRGEIQNPNELPALGKSLRHAAATVRVSVSSEDEGRLPRDMELPFAPVDQVIRTPEGYRVVEVLEMLYAAEYDELRPDYEGEMVQIVGQFLPGSSSDPEAKRFKCMRMFMFCCAADATPLATFIEADEMPKVPKMTWLRITGKATFPLHDGRRTSVIRATAIEQIPPPGKRTLY